MHCQQPIWHVWQSQSHRSALNYQENDLLLINPTKNYFLPCIFKRTGLCRKGTTHGQCWHWTRLPARRNTLNGGPLLCSFAHTLYNYSCLWHLNSCAGLLMKDLFLPFCFRLCHMLDLTRSLRASECV